KTFTHIAAPAYFLNPELLALIACTMVNLSLQYGNCRYSAFAYSSYGIILCAALGHFDLAYSFGQLAFQVNEKISSRDLIYRSYHAFGTFINHFRHHARMNIDYLRKGYQYSIENGDIILAGYCGNVIIYYLLLMGYPLDDTYPQSQSYLDFVLRAKDQDTADNLIVSQQAILHLQGKTVHST